MAFIPTLLFYFLCLLHGLSGNDNVFEQYRFQVNEGLPIGTIIGEIPNPTKEKNPRYVLLQDQGKRFRLSKDGKLYTNVVFDRETLKSSERKSGFKLLIGRGKYGFIAVTVTIKDLNDNRPLFPVKSYTVKVREDIAPGKDIAFPNAVDPDLNFKSDIVYTIESGNIYDNFKLEKLKPGGMLEDMYFLVLKENTDLDVETKADRINLTISVCDRAFDLCDYLNVTILVEDVNDNFPIFDPNLPDSIEIYENVSLSVPIFQMKATDRDRGTNGIVEYEIFNNNEFTIHPRTGEIHVMTKDLDAETDDLKSMLIIAKDMGNPSKKKDFYFRIKILDCNEPPKLKVTPHSTDRFDLKEETLAGFTVGTLMVNDLDLTSANNKISKVFLTSGQEYFKLERTTDKILNGRKTRVYFIKTTKPIDHERQPTVLLSASAVDSGLPPLTGIVNYTMKIEDINDNPPVFQKKYYVASINESQPAGAFVVQVKATDADVGQNADITYSITSKPGKEAFYIDPDSGKIMLNERIDREVYGYMLIHISARDHGLNPLSGEAIVNVTILDGNDNDPEFVSTLMEYSITENNKIGDFIGKMKVQDADLIGSDSITCSIVNKNFRVDLKTCNIYANKVFDREQKNSYRMTAVVRDGLGRTSTGKVVINIKDVNDNMPKFIARFFNLSVHTNFPVGQSAVFLEAVDPDKGDNALQLFSAAFADGDGFLLSIDSYSGGIKLLMDLTKVDKKKFLFTVSVTDKAIKQPRAADTAHVQLNILPPSTRPPFFESPQYTFSIKEHDVIGCKVGQVKAKRPISNSETFMKYSIKSGNNKGTFDIDQSGLITATRSTDYEENNWFELTVEVQDTLQPSLAATAKVIINVIDLNDNWPRFINSKNVIKVREGVALGHLLYTCKTEDLDSGENGKVTHRIKHTTGHFTIDKTTGEVRTTGSLDYETSESHVIYIEATDGGDPPLSTTFRLEAKVEDVNDNPPLFYNNSETVKVYENNKINQLILKLNASDADDNENGEFSFSLLPSEDAKSFNLLDDGSLYVTKSLDRESKSSYGLRAKVQDRGTPPRSSEATITVFVGDENDEAPIFEKQLYEFKVKEEMAPGTVVGSVVAVDADTGDNGKFTYYLRDQHKDKFEIETKYIHGKHVCIIKTKKKFDSETEPANYNITIGASDHGMTGNSNEVSVHIQVQNINDHPPEFISTTPYVACVTDGTPANSKVVKVTANDLDKIQVNLVYSLIALEDSHKISLKLFRIAANGTIFTETKIKRSVLKQPMYEMIVKVEENFQDVRDYQAGPLYTNYQKVVVFIAPKPKGLLFKEHCPHITITSSDDKEKIAKHSWQYDPSYQIGNYRIILHDTYNVPFGIRPTTGIIKVLSNPNQPNQFLAPFYQLNVTADGTKDAKTYTESILLNVYVVPKNMYPPAYPKNPEIYHIAENHPLNKPISTLKEPIDRDKGMEGKCIFSIEDSVDAPVKVSPLTREIMFTRDIDREKIDKIVVKIRVSDLAEQLPLRLSNTLTVAIYVKDVNDNPPRFISKNQINVLEDEKVNAIIENVLAIDPDMGSTKTDIEYAILSGNFNDTFALDPFTGALSIRKSLSIRTKQEYKLKILAFEKREATELPRILSLNSTFYLTVHVKDVNNEKPRFLQHSYKARVKENQPVGTEVVRLQSVDDDLKPEYKEVVYEMIMKDIGFEIDPKSGVIYTTTEHDREIRNKFIFDVIVRNVAPPHGEDSCEVEISIDDVNDNPPQFSGGPREEHHLMENSKPVPRSFHKLMYTDADESINAEVTFSIVRFTNPSKAIRLDTKTGQLWLDEVLDREKRSKYEFTVEARNVQPPHHKVIQNITVIVDDENDEDPVFEKKLYRETIREGQSVNATVLVVKAFDADVASNAEVQYSIVNTSEDALQHFSVNERSGAISLVQPLDYELTKYYKFQVKATGFISDSFDVTTVEIQVKDENDNRPKFSQIVYDFRIDQIQTHSKIGVVKATDKDMDGKQQVTYSFRPYSKEFSIHAKTGEVFIQNPSLIRGQYRLHVIAKDDGLPPAIEDLAEVLVTTPAKSSLAFLNSSVVFSIDENPPKNLYLGRVIAVSQTHSKIKYQIDTTSNPEKAFRINPDTGDLYVNNEKAVDYEKYANFFLGVLATTEQPKDVKFLHVLVNLVDINDNSPEIMPKNLTFNYQETNFQPFKPMHVYQFLVKDADNIDKDRLKLRIISGNEDGLFHIDKWHRLSLVKNMDYETKSRHHLVVRVTDGGNPVRYADSHFYFNVEDQNDNEPIFEKILPVDVSEAANVGTLLAQVHAIDKDIMKTDMKYSITKEGSSPNISMFHIDESNGKVYLVHPLDYERSSSYKLRLCAYDGVHRSYGVLHINVLDVNDHSPRFSKAIYTVKNVQSPLSKDQFIVKVDATDKDEGDYGFVQYKLEPSRDQFMIDQYTGKIFANKAYKFAPGVVRLTVVAYDSKDLQGSRSSKAMVEVHISQTESGNLQFSNAVYHFSIEEQTPEGVRIGTVRADFPTGFYQPLRYRIIDGNAGGMFTIDRKSGHVKTYRDLDREKKSKYTLVILAEVQSLPPDSDSESMSAKCTVKLEILDLNDNQPVFDKNVYHATVFEDIPIGTKLLQVKATDADDPKQPYGKLAYSIHSGQEGFEWLWINETDGTIKTREKLDREIASTIQLSIRVADVEGTGMEAFTSLNATILDINDNAPEFNFDVKLMHNIHIKENQPAHTMVFKANAKDRDTGENGRVSYRLLKGAGISNFYMNDSTPGWVYTRKTLDYENENIYKVIVVAYDNGSPMLESSLEYNINVDDLDEYIPVFRSSGYSFDIYGNLEVGDIVGNVSASDEDGGSAGIVYYSIEPKEMNSFVVGRRSGVIKVNKDLRKGKVTNSVEESKNRRRRNLDNNQVEKDENIENIRFKIRADNGPNTTVVTTEIVVRVNYTCAGCSLYTTLKSTEAPMKATTTVVVLASIAIFLVILFVLCIAYFMRKKGCSHRRKHPVERELLNSGASSFDRLQQHFYNGELTTEKSRVSSETGLLPDRSGTGRSVSATDKASTYSFGIYHEQGKTESDMQRLGDTLSEMTLIKELEDDSVFGYSSGKLKSEPTKSLISRSTQESSLYSLSSNAVHRNGYNFIPRQTTKLISTTRSDSHESLKDFMEEGGGEAAGGIDVGNLLYAKLAEVSAEEQDAIMESVRPFQEEGPLSHGGSFSTIIGSDDDVRRSYGYSYNNWKSSYLPINSVFSEIGRNGGPPPHHPTVNYGYNQTDIMPNGSVAKQPHVNINNRLRHPDAGKVLKPPLLPQPVRTQSPMVNDIPLQVLNSGRTSMLSSIISLPRLPQELQSTYTSGALSPNFTPAMTPLVLRSPSVSSIEEQDDYSSQAEKSTRSGNFDIGFTNLRRVKSNVSQLSRVTLSDLEISDAEIEV